MIHGRQRSETRRFLRTSVMYSSSFSCRDHSSNQRMSVFLSTAPMPRIFTASLTNGVLSLTAHFVLNPKFCEFARSASPVDRRGDQIDSAISNLVKSPPNTSQIGGYCRCVLRERPRVTIARSKHWTTCSFHAVLRRFLLIRPVSTLRKGQTARRNPRRMRASGRFQEQSLWRIYGDGRFPLLWMIPIRCGTKLLESVP